MTDTGPKFAPQLNKLDQPSKALDATTAPESGAARKIRCQYT